MHKHKLRLFAEGRLLRFDGATPEGITGDMLAREQVTTQTASNLQALRGSIGAPPAALHANPQATMNTLHALEGKLVTTGLAAFNIALFASLFAAGIYMIVKGDLPPQMKRLLGQKT